MLQSPAILRGSEGSAGIVCLSQMPGRVAVGVQRGPPTADWAVQHPDIVWQKDSGALLLLPKPLGNKQLAAP